MLVFPIALLAMLVLALLVFFGFFSSKNPQKVMSENAGSEDSQDILVKKYKSADVNAFSTMFFMVGLCITLGSLLMAFEFVPKQDDDGTLAAASFDDEEIEEIPLTNQTPPPPPPPPPPPEVIEVEDDEEIEEEPEIFEQEFEQEQVIEEPVVVDEPVEVEEPEEPDFFIVVEDMPEFPGGEKEMYKFLGKNIKYPQIAKENGISGKVYVRFIIDEGGSVKDAKVMRGIGGGCDEEALRVVNKMPKWKPGKQRGKSVKVQYTIPIHFALQ